jgi:hypothetical protein
MLSTKALVPGFPIRPTAGPTWENYSALDVESGDKARDSAAVRESLRVKLFAKGGGANKPRRETPYNLLQTLLYIRS